MRLNNRPHNQLRPITIEINTNPFAEGSCTISAGLTKIICTATADSKLPHFLKGKGTGWLTAEYNMLPRATQSRVDREAVKGKQSGRTQEIQRLIGRSLRSVLNLEALKENQIKIDCDVIIADAGTRTLAITGGFVAMYLAVNKMLQNKVINVNPINEFIAAVSCGVVNNNVLLDLDYSEDSTAQVDGNFVITQSGNIVEIQTTAEKQAFSQQQLFSLVELANNGVQQLIACQQNALKDYL